MKKLLFPLSVVLALTTISTFYLWQTPWPKPVFPDRHMSPKDWYAYQRSYPSGVINPDAVIEGMMQAQSLKAASPRMRTGWQFAGPTNIGGRVTDVEIAPDDSSVVYLGASTGGIFKSTDNCQTWESIFDDQPILTIGDIAIDPTNSNVVYAGTGEANAVTFGFLGDGMYKSMDAGATWTHIGLENGAYVSRIVVDYENPQRVFAAVAGDLYSPGPNRGIFRSDDGGASWERKLFVTDTTSGIDLVQHPSNPDILYAAMWERCRGLNYRRSFGYSSGIYKTTDGGETWTELTNGLPSYPMGRIGLTISPTNPDILYAFCDNIYSIDVFRTQDGGATWVQTNDAALQGMNSDFGWYFGQVRVDPQNAQRVYVMGVELWRTDDGGANWIQLAGYNIDNILHVDHHAMAINPVTGTILEGNDGGLFRSYDLGLNWQKFYQLPLTQFYEVEIDYQNPNRLYGGTQDNNSIRTWAGNVNQWNPILGGDGFYCLVNYEDPDVVYAEYQNGGLCKSTDAGNSFFSIVPSEMAGDRINWSMPIAMDPFDPDIILAGTHRLWRSDFGGFGWLPLTDDLTKGPDGSGWHTISTIAISKLNSDLVVVGTDDGLVHFSNDGGFSFTNVTNGLPDRYVTRVATDPQDENIIYATFSGFRWDEPLPYVFRSTNQGASWENISGNLPQLPVNAIAIDPQNGTIIVGTDAGVFFTKDIGQHWYALADGLCNVPVMALKIHEPTRMLLAGTHGRSSYKISLDDIQVGITEPVNKVQSLEVTPNPYLQGTGENLKIVYTLPAPTQVEISILDVKGTVIKTLRNSKAVAGRFEALWDGSCGSRFPVSGILFCRMKTEYGTTVKKFIIQ